MDVDEYSDNDSDVGNEDEVMGIDYFRDEVTRMTDIFFEVGCTITKHNPLGSYEQGLRRFRGNFGISPIVCAYLWIRLTSVRPPHSKPIHLLYALQFLKSYETEERNRSSTGVDEKTFRKYSKLYVELLATHINAVDWERRRDGEVELEVDGTFVRVSVDCTDCPIQEPNGNKRVNFDDNRDYYSKKEGGAALRYEVAVCIATGAIVWFYGGIPAGSNVDLEIARQSLIYHLDADERAVADDGYKDRIWFVITRYYPELRRQLKAISQRHETVNKRLKVFNVLKNTFRHSEEYHQLCFAAVAQIVQSCFDLGEKLYDLEIAPDGI